jgi:hypothetical protein
MNHSSRGVSLSGARLTRYWRIWIGMANEDGATTAQREFEGFIISQVF